MSTMLDVRPMKFEECGLMMDYFINSSESFLLGMGALKEKLLDKQDWLSLLKEDFQKPLSEREFYYLIWLFDDRPVGHTNINQIEFGSKAKMHLHLWNSSDRQKGIALKFLKLSIPMYFEHFKLKNLICEPFAENIGPNKLILKLGFKFSDSFICTPGWINFEQKVNSYVLTKEDFTANILNIYP